VGEFGLIREHFAQMRCARLGQATLGIGDDCAILPMVAGAQWAVSSDMLVSGRHFFPDVAPYRLGHKALAVNLSDLAAMGAKPRAFTLSIALPQRDDAWLEQFCAGMDRLACAHQCELVGGDTTRGPLAISITIMGELPAGAGLRRDRAELGDEVWISGSLGGAALALDVLLNEKLVPAQDLRDSLEIPEPRVLLGLGLQHLARAAIDISDGLVQDASHICERSRVGMQLDWVRIPRHPGLGGADLAMQQQCVLSGGDDYELLFCAAPENHWAIATLGEQLGLRLACVGRVEVGERVRVLDARGHEIMVRQAGFDHFV
jgi:thiamine-monophosphate kinase